MLYTDAESHDAVVKAVFAGRRVVVISDEKRLTDGVYSSVLAKVRFLGLLARCNKLGNQIYLDCNGGWVRMIHVRRPADLYRLRGLVADDVWINGRYAFQAGLVQSILKEATVIMAQGSATRRRDARPQGQGTPHEEPA